MLFLHKILIMGRRHILLFALISLLLFSFFSCKNKNTPVNVTKPTITKRQIENAKNIKVNILRYEQDLFKIDQKNMAAEIAYLYGKYPDNLISNKAWENQEMLAFLKNYLNDPTNKQLYNDTQIKYSDLSKFKNEITPALTLYLTHFPGESVPDFCTLISGMDVQMPSVFGYENTIFICLDMYLGKDYKQYSQAGIPKFIQAHCEEKYLPTDCFTKVLVYKHLPDKTLVSLLDNIIDAGKKIMFTQTMFPTYSEQDLLGYSKEQFQWATKHESAVWHFLIEKNLLYDKSDDVTRRMIDETPFTRDFGNNSPGRIGWYIGYQIVKSYMRNHPGTTLNDLLKMSDSQKFLKDSSYKPE